MPHTVKRGEGTPHSWGFGGRANSDRHSSSQTIFLFSLFFWVRKKTCVRILLYWGSELCNELTATGLITMHDCMMCRAVDALVSTHAHDNRRYASSTAKGRSLRHPGGPRRRRETRDVAGRSVVEGLISLSAECRFLNMGISGYSCDQSVIMRPCAAWALACACVQISMRNNSITTIIHLQAFPRSRARGG